MKLLHVFFFCLFPCILIAQQKPYELRANESTKVIVVFNSPIETAIVGTKNFAFGFNRNMSSKIGILTAKKNASATNLHVITTRGNIYQFILKYDSNNSEYYHSIDPSSSIDNINGKVVLSKDQGTTEEKLNFQKSRNVSKPVTNNVFYDTTSQDSSVVLMESEREEPSEMYMNNPNEYFRKYAHNQLTLDKDFYVRSFAINQKVFLKLNNIVYNKNELYFMIEIDNRSAIDYDVDYLNFEVTFRKKRARSTSQSIPQTPRLKYNIPRSVPSKSKRKFVYVFTKFSLSRDNVLLLELGEVSGSRNIQLQLDHSTVNNPN